MKNLDSTPQEMIEECGKAIAGIKVLIDGEEELITKNNEDIQIYTNNIETLKRIIIEKQNDNIAINSRIDALNSRIGVENDIINYINSL